MSLTLRSSSMASWNMLELNGDVYGRIIYSIQYMCFFFIATFDQANKKMKVKGFVQRHTLAFPSGFWRKTHQMKRAYPILGSESSGFWDAMLLFWRIGSPWHFPPIFFYSNGLADQQVWQFHHRENHQKAGWFAYGWVYKKEYCIYTPQMVVLIRQMMFNHQIVGCSPKCSGTKLISLAFPFKFQVPKPTCAWFVWHLDCRLPLMPRLNRCMEAATAAATGASSGAFAPALSGLKDAVVDVVAGCAVNRRSWGIELRKHGILMVHGG